MPTLRDTALAALTAQRETQRTTALEQGGELIELLTQITGLPESAFTLDAALVREVIHPVAFVDNLAFIPVPKASLDWWGPGPFHMPPPHRGLMGVALLSRCDDCGEALISATITKLAHLGTQLDSFTPRDYHDCPVELVPPPPSNDQRIQAMRKFFAAWNEVDNLVWD